MPSVKCTTSLCVMAIIAVLAYSTLQWTDYKRQAEDRRRITTVEQIAVPQYLPLSGFLNSSNAYALIQELEPQQQSNYQLQSNNNTTSTTLEQVDFHKFWAMFGVAPWTRRQIGEQACFDAEPNFWETLRGASDSMCNRNWYQGGANNPRMNDESYRPDFMGAALLGINTPEITKYACEESTGDAENRQCRKRGITKATMDAKYTILRLEQNLWNMCRNLEWVVCAVRGLLPNQEGGIAFATPPSTVNLGDFLLRNKTCKGRCDHSYREPDIFMMEASVVSFLCRNRDDLFSFGSRDHNRRFVCDFDHRALEVLTEAAKRSRGGRASDPTVLERKEIGRTFV